MTTKTITANVDPAEAQPGDMFTGTLDRDDVTYTVTGPLKGGSPHGSNLYVTLHLPYVNVIDGVNYPWRDVSVTREVQVMKFAPGTVVRYGNDPSLYVRNNDGTWSETYLGGDWTEPWTQIMSNSDDAFRRSVEAGYAKVIYNPEAS